MLALFVATTGDNLPDLVYSGMDAVAPDVAPTRADWSPSALFFIVWTVFGMFMALNLFVGAIVDKFAEIRREADGILMMTPAQVQAGAGSK